MAVFDTSRCTSLPEAYEIWDANKKINKKKKKNKKKNIVAKKSVGTVKHFV